MRVAYLVAGAGGMYCGSCLHDARLATALRAGGRDVLLIPLYTPLRTDESDVSPGPLFYGGLNAYLQQITAGRRLPGWLERLLDTPWLLRLAGGLAGNARPEMLGAMTVSVLAGPDGAQRRELEKLIAGLRELRPSVVHLPNLMFLGAAAPLKAELGAAIVCGLTGEDIFIDQLSQPHQSQAREMIRRHAAACDAFVALTDYYASRATAHFGLPADRVHRIPLGIHAGDFARPAARRGGEPANGSAFGDRVSLPSPNPSLKGRGVREPASLSSPDPSSPRRLSDLKGRGVEPFTIGYLARVCPDKGLAELARAFVHLRHAGRRCRLRVAGYLGQSDRPYLEQVRADLRAAGVRGEEFEYAGPPTREGKIRFLHSLDVLSVPTAYPEAKGLYVLEALAAGVPVVQPSHGAFPELIAATGGGLLYPPGRPEELAVALGRLMDDETLRLRLADAGQAAVARQFSTAQAAAGAWRVYEHVLGRSGRPRSESEEGR